MASHRGSRSCHLPSAWSDSLRPILASLASEIFYVGTEDASVGTKDAGQKGNRGSEPKQLGSSEPWLLDGNVSGTEDEPN